MIEWWIFEWYSFVPNKVSSDEIVIWRDSFIYSFVQSRNNYLIDRINKIIVFFYHQFVY